MKPKACPECGNSLIVPMIKFVMRDIPAAIYLYCDSCKHESKHVYLMDESIRCAVAKASGWGVEEE